VRLVLTLLVRDEADVVGTQLEYHLNAGVDFVVATDHESRDGTAEILESYSREGHLRLIHERGPLTESVWRTRMARLAATEHGADWVINTDADEFWLPRRGTLKDTFAAIPERYGIVWALTRPFVPRPDDDRSFAERMTVRLSALAPINDPASPYRPHAKAAHRGDPAIVVRFGSHLADSPTLVPLRDWYPADVLHFPYRTQAQYERKGVRRAHGDKPLAQYVRAYQASAENRVGEQFGALVVDDDALERGRESGTLVVDTRLRDALRSESPVESPETQPSLGEALAVLEGSALREADLVRLQRSVDALDARLAAVERRRTAWWGRTRARWRSR
jgi:hypothetical protein